MKKNRVSARTSAVAAAVAVAMAGIPLGLAGCATAKPATAKPATANPATANPATLAQAARSVAAVQSADKARLTGYASASVSGGASGPISVALHGATVARLDQLVNGLQKWTGASCMENIQLYAIDFTHLAGAKRSLRVAGDECANLVSITSDGKTVTRVDGKCALLTAVRRLLPATAKATRQLTPPDCVS